LASWCRRKNLDRTDLKFQNFSLLIVAEYGNRGLTKYARGAATTKKMADQMRIAFAKPTLMSRLSRIKGMTAPPSPAAHHMMPNAMPLRLSNHWSMNTTHGQKAKEPLVPKRMPWTPMSWGTVVQNELASVNKKAPKSPRGDSHRAQKG